MSVQPERSFGAVIRDIGGNVDRIIRAELRFAAAELRQGMEAAGEGALYVLAGALCATLAIGFLLLGLMFALATIMPIWVAAFVVALLVGGGATALLVAGRSKLTHQFHSKETAVAPHTESPE